MGAAFRHPVWSGIVLIYICFKLNTSGDCDTPQLVILGSFFFFLVPEP